MIGEGLAEAAADIQDARGEPGRPGAFEQPQAVIGRLDPVPRLAGVQVKGKPEEVHDVLGRA